MILWGSMLALYVFSFVLGFILLARLDKVINQIKENQQGTTCILLIMPQDRNTNNITDCIDSNRSKPGENFQFNPPSNNSNPSSNNTVNKVIEVPRSEPYISNIKEAPPSNPVREVLEQALPIETNTSVCPANRPIEINVLNLLQFKCKGDRLWQTK